MFLTRRARPLLLALALTLSSLSIADIRYETEIVNGNRLQVKMSFPVKGTEATIQMPNWSPGAYVTNVPARNITDLTVSSGSATKENDNTWKITGIQGGNVTVTYSVPSAATDGAYHWSGPSTYFYVVDRKIEKSFLKVNKPADWKLAVGLDEVKGQPNTFVARDYDVLADNPVSLGDLMIDTYNVLGREHTIAMRGRAREKVNRDYLIKACRHVTEAQVSFMKDMPYNKYVWHFSVFEAPDGAGGLEHLSSTQISLSSGVGPRAVSVLSHEFFHLWNVKRIRAKVLGPFDYNKIPPTGTLWWLEGTTDYYAHRLLHDYRWWDRQMFYNDIKDQVTRVRNNPAHLEVSPYESSFRMPETNDGRGNSDGYRISYYTLGWLAGLCLDTEIRHQTNNKRSLDDVTRALYAMTRDNKPGFEEDEIRKQCIKFGGPALGPFYDRVIMKAGPMPVEEQLAKFGLTLAQIDEPYTDAGFSVAPGRGQGGIRVGQQIREHANALKAGDVILAINGKNLDRESGRENSQIVATELGAIKAGTPLALKVRRGEETLDVTVTPIAATRKIWNVTESNMSPEMRRKLETWLAPRAINVKGVKVGEKDLSRRR